MISKVIRFALLCAFLAALPVRAAAPEYQGPDAGLVIYSTASITIPMNFTFHYKRVRLATGEAVSEGHRIIECKCVGVWRAQMANPDFTGQDTGKVFVQRLPPGHYVVYDFVMSGGRPIGGNSFTSSRKKFAIPFEIKSGEATYIGAFARAPSLQTPMEPVTGAMGYFVISDKSERDLAIARARHPDLPAVTSLVFDVSKLGHPAILAKEPEWVNVHPLRPWRDPQKH